MMDPSELMVTQLCLALRPNTGLVRITTCPFDHLAKCLVVSRIFCIVLICLPSSGRANSEIQRLLCIFIVGWFLSSVGVLGVDGSNGLVS